MVAGSELCIDEWPVMNSGKDGGGFVIRMKVALVLAKTVFGNEIFAFDMYFNSCCLLQDIQITNSRC